MPRANSSSGFYKTARTENLNPMMPLTTKIIEQQNSDSKSLSGTPYQRKGHMSQRK